MLAPEKLVDLERYPLLAPGTPRGKRVVSEARAELARVGMAVLPGFLRDEVLAPLARECDALAALGHFSEVRGTPYIDVPDFSLPEGHPRRTLGRSALSAVAYDRFPPSSGLRALYEWDPLLEFVRVLLGRERLFRYADPLGALNLAVMRDGDELAWHYDQTDFVVSIAIQSSESGGEFECVPMIRDIDDERYDDVRALLAGDPRVPVTGVPMTPGTLMLFEGRRSIHRVSPIRGERPRHVALLAYDTKPGTDSSELLKRVRYGRLPGE
ncbi:MAG: HalD/BesD family halogenase [Myxococcota bacterium]